MKLKRRRVVEVPPKIRSFINRVKSSSLENIEEPLKNFSWHYDKGDFHHWVELFNHFDSYFEKFVKQRKDLQFDFNFLEAESLFPRESVIEILRVTRVILENCTNKHFYSSFEQHLSSLLACTDVDVVEASLKTLAAFLKKTVGKCSIRDSNLTSKLFAFSQGWGSKEEGLGLVACSMQDGCDSGVTRAGSAVHFEFYAESDVSTQSSSTGTSNKRLQVIHLPDIKSYSENDLVLLNKLIEQYKVPPRLCFSLFTRLRFARAFNSPVARQQYVCIRLYAFIILVQACNDSDDLSTFFNNEPEFVNELVSLLTYEDSIPEKIRMLGILSLAALCHDRSHQPTVLAAVSSGGHRGLLPGLMQKAIDSITNETGKWSIEFAEALLSLVTILVSSSPGSSALREAGFIPTLLPLLKDTKPQHIHLVSTAVLVLEAFMDYSNPAVALFRDLGGLDDTIARLKLEVSHVEQDSKKCGEDFSCRRGKQVLDSSSMEDSQIYHSEAMVSYHRKLLLKALLGAISLGTYAPGSNARVYGSEENLLPQCLCTIFRRAKDFGGGVFSLGATVMSDLIHKDPTCFSVLDAAGLPQSFLDSITTEVLSSSEAITCIPQCLDAVCLNNSGLQAVKDCNALSCFVKIFTSRAYLQALGGDTPKSLSSGLDELIRHASSLRSPAVDIFLEILNTISKIGSGTEVDSSESQCSSALMVLETCLEDKGSVVPGEAEASKIECSEQMVEGSSDMSALHVENFLPECISNATRLLETVLQNGDTCRLFIERKGIESVLELFNLPLMPLFSSIGQNVAVAFKNFSPVHSITLARAICSFLKEHLNSLNELLLSVDGANLLMLEDDTQMKVLRSLSSLENILSLSNFLLKATTSLVSEFGTSDVDVLKDLGKAYKEILWQMSLYSVSKKEDNRTAEHETGNADGQTSTTAGRESDGNTNVVSVHGHMSPFSVRSGSVSYWRVEQEFLSVVRSTEGLHRHGRHGLSRTRGGRTSRYLDISNLDSESSNNIPEVSLIQDVKKKNPDVLVSELLNKLGCSLRSFYAALVKGLTARRRSDHGSLSPACKNIATALAKLFLEALSYSGQAAVLEMSLSVKCHYLGKVVNDMVSLIFDSRRRLCNTALVNSFYVNGTFKELLTTFEATSQLLWTLPHSLPISGLEQGKFDGSSRASNRQSSWLLETLQSYCHLLDYFVNSSLLLSPSSPSHAELLVQPVSSGLSIGLFAVPRDPEVLVEMLQTQVLDVILPIWNNPMFSSCNPAFISSVISIVTRIYSGVGDLKIGHNSTGNVGQRVSARALDETSIASIVEMGFTRARAEEALRSIGTNSVEIAMDWLFSHPEEYAQEDVQLAQALELSLGGTTDASKEDNNDSNRTKDTISRERGAEVPPADDILSTSMKLFQNGDAITFPLTDLLVTLCNRNNGVDRPKVVYFLIQQLKACSLGSSTGTGALSQMSHILALLLSEETTTRVLAAENGIVAVVLDILNNFTRNGIKDDISISKCLSSLFLILNNMVQAKTKVSSEENGKNNSGSQSEEIPIQDSVPGDKISSKGERHLTNAFENILGKPTGHLTLEDSHRALEIACKFIKIHTPAVVMQAVLQLCARLTKTHCLAMQFLDNKCSSSLFNLPSTCFFPGFDSLASAIIRHLLEDPQTLQTTMELEIRQTLSGSLNRNSGKLSPRMFLTSMAPVILRDPVIFMKAAAVVCQLDSSGGRTNIVLSREKDKDKPKFMISDSPISSHVCVRIPENKSSDQPSKCSRSQRKVPTSLFQVIDELLEIIMRYQTQKNQDSTNSIAIMDIDESTTNGKGKSKIDGDIVSEKSASLARITFTLKLLSDIMLMYIHAVGVVLKRDVDAWQSWGLGLGEESTPGVVHHVLHQLLPLSDKGGESLDEWEKKLSEKSSWFLVVLCGRSGEGRKRVIGELVKAFSSFTKLESNSLVPNKKILAFTDLVHSILSKNSSSSSLPGSGCSPDIARAMIDGGMVQSLTIILQALDLDHPDAPKVVNLILKSLEILTRAANASDQLCKSEGVNKKKPSATTERSETFPVHDQNVNSQNDNNDVTHNEEEQLIQRSSQDLENQQNNVNQSMDQDTIAGRIENDARSLTPVHGVEFMHEEIDGQDVLHNTNSVDMPFQGEHRADEDMVDDDMEEDVDEDDDEDDDEDIAEEGARLMSLADTDADDHDENGPGDEYNDEMIDEDDDAFPENGVIEVRWREGLTGLDQLRVLRDSSDTSHFFDITAEPFQRANADDLFHFHRPLGIEHRRHNVRSFLDRSSSGSNGFQHPLLIRPSHLGDPSVLSWQSMGNISRDIDSLSSGTFDLSQFYMIDNGISSDYSGATLFGDRLVGAVPPHLIDFSLGVDSLNVGGRRGLGDGRWSDDGRPQPGAQGSAIAQALEELFLSHMRASDDSSQAQKQLGISTSQENEQQNVPLSTRNPLITVNDVSGQQSGSPHEQMTFVSEHQQGNVDIGNDPLLPNTCHMETDRESTIGEMEGILRTSEPTSVDVQNNSPIGHNNMHSGIGVDLAGEITDTAPEGNDTSLLNVNLQMQENSEMSADLPVSEHPTRCINGPLGTESQSSSLAVIDSGCTMAELSDGHAGMLNVSNNVDVNGTDGTENLINCSNPLSMGEEASAREQTVVQEEANQVDLINNNDNSASDSIDPTFLEALPEDLRAEVLASQQDSQQVQPVQDAAHAPPPPEEIDPEFLAALPPDIQAEVLAQQRAQRFIHSQQVEGPVDMDNASILATFPPDLREEVLLTSPDTVLSSLPSNFLAEAQILRDRAASHYHARSSLFGGSHRLGGRRLAVDRQGVMDRGVGATIDRTAVSGTASNINMKEVEGIPLMDTNALKALIRLLRLAQPLGKGLLQRLLLNLCAHTATRATLIHLLLDMIKLEADESASSSTRASQGLFGCECNVVYGLSWPSDGLPPLVSRRVLELLTYLATNHFSVANLLFYFDHLSVMESSSQMRLDQKSKGKAKVSDVMLQSDMLESSWEENIPLLLLFKLLNKPLFLRSSVHLEQVMCLLQVVVNNAVSNVHCQLHSSVVSVVENSESNPANISHMGNGDSTPQKDSSGVNLEMSMNTSQGLCYGEKRTINPFDILSKLPECDLRNLCSLLAREGLSDKIHSLAAEVVKKLAFAAVSLRKFFSAELANVAHGLSVSARHELITLRNTEMLGLSAGSMAGAAILHILQTLATLVSTSDENKNQDIDTEQQDQSILQNLNSMLEPLWRELSDCIGVTEAKLGQSSTLSSPVPISVAGELVGVSSSLSPTLPPGTQRLLPFIEAFFVLCEKLQVQSIMQLDVNATAGEVKESAGGSSSPSVKYGGIGSLTFARVVEKHRRLLNAFVRQNPGLLEKSLSMMLKLPRMIDFDNKRAYFRSRIRQQHDQHPSASLRISVRRAYVLEDSYNQLRMRSSQDLKGRLTVQFQGEEGIDAGGLTREWYQLLSRVIFDKGALLFTTVGNNATFQPNPNSVYQTEHLSYFKFVGRVVAKALFDGQLLDIYFTRSFYKHILGVKVTYHDIEAVDPDYYKNLKWMLENDVSDILDLTFSMDADEEKHILYEKTEVTDYELKPGGGNIRVTEETKHEYVDLVAEHILTTAIRPQINSFLEGFSELIPRELISIFNDKELELLISGLPEIDLNDLKANTEYTGYTSASTVMQWFWDVVKSFNKEDMARFLQFVTGTSKVPLEGFKALQGISGPQRFQIHKAYGAPERLPSAHTCFNQLDLPEYSSKQQLEERLLLAIHEASEGFGFG